MSASVHDSRSRSSAPRAPEPTPMPEGELQELALASPAAHHHAKIQAMADDSPQVRKTAGFQDLADQAIHAAAAAGTRGEGGTLPHLDAIQSSFGHHDVSSIHAHTSPDAQASARDIGVEAFASGEHVVFDAKPSLFVAAHEAAHVIQQRGGVQLFGGVGRPGDAHEHHADEVAHLVERGESAQAALDRYADPARPQASAGALQPFVQFWGEPDHYAMGQLAGKKTIEVLREVKETTGLLSDDFVHKTTDKFTTKGSIMEGIDKRVVEDTESGEEDIFVIRDSKGKGMSYGAANRFAGDLSATPLGTGGRAPTLEQWPGKIGKKKDDYRHIGFAAEASILATNANHFFPLAGIEYLRQHRRAMQMMWMAVEMRRAGEGSVAQTVARRALMVEGFASHFLADCFAAGHLSPHALGRIGDKTAYATGAKVNTWHDLFNALPDGVPTTLGRFHGDYGMDGHDLEYVSSVIANSLLEIAMPWYAGRPFNGNVVLPEPDVDGIMTDPVIGPLWAQMCGDYSAALAKLVKLERRKDKKGLSKYTIYETTGGQQVSNSEVIKPILAKTFGGTLEGGKPVDDTSGDLPLIRGKVRSLVIALEQLLDYRDGWQASSGLSKSFEPLDVAPKKTKFDVDLKSSKLASASPATSPIIPLATSFQYWLETWASSAMIDEKSNETLLREGLSKVSELPSLIESTKSSGYEALRVEYIKLMRWAKTQFRGLGVPVKRRPDTPHYEQGPKAMATRSKKLSEMKKRLELVHGTDEMVLGPALKDEISKRQDEFRVISSSSGRIISTNITRLKETHEKSAEAAAAYASMGAALEAFVDDPRPPNRSFFLKLYQLMGAKLKAIREAIGTDPDEKVLLELDGWAEEMGTKFSQWQKLGTKKGKTHESARREILIQLRDYLNRDDFFDFDEDQLWLSLGRVLGDEIDELDEGEDV